MKVVPIQKRIDRHVGEGRRRKRTMSSQLSKKRIFEG